MKQSSSFMLAAGIAALFAAPALQAADEAATPASPQETPRQLGGPGIQDGAADVRDTEAGRDASAAQPGEESLSGSTGSRGTVDPAGTQSNEPPQPGAERGGSMSGATGATGASSAAESPPEESSKPATDWPYGSTQPGSPASESVNVPNDSSTR